MLREELKDSDIPHRTTIRTRIMEIWDEHLDQLQAEMKVCHPTFCHLFFLILIIGVSHH